MTDAEWSEPELYGSGQVVLQPPDQADVAWGVTTYVGPKRYRPVANNQMPHPAVQATSEPEPPPADDDRSLLASSRTMAIASPRIGRVFLMVPPLFSTSSL